MTYFGDSQQFLKIAESTFDHIDHILKFGRNNTLASGVREDIWDGSSDYTWPTTADITHIKAAASGDEGLTIEVQGLDTDYAIVTQSVDLDATDSSTLVALTTALRRVFRLKVDDSTDATNNIGCYNSAGTTLYGQITTPFNQSLMALYTVPAGKTAYLTRYYCMINKKVNASIEIELYVRPFGKVFQLKHNGVIASGGDAHWDFNFFPHSPPMVITEKSDIKLTGIASAAGVDSSAGFDLILIDD